MTMYDNISDEQLDEVCAAWAAVQTYPFNYHALPERLKDTHRDCMRAALKKLPPIVVDEGMVERVVAFLNRTKFDRSGPLIGCEIRAILTAALTVPEPQDDPPITVAEVSKYLQLRGLPVGDVTIRAEAVKDITAVRAMERARTQRQQGEKS